MTRDIKRTRIGIIAQHNTEVPTHAEGQGAGTANRRTLLGQALLFFFLLNRGENGVQNGRGTPGPAALTTHRSVLAGMLGEQPAPRTSGLQGAAPAGAQAGWSPSTGQVARTASGRPNPATAGRSGQARGVQGLPVAAAQQPGLTCVPLVPQPCVQLPGEGMQAELQQVERGQGEEGPTSSGQKRADIGKPSSLQNGSLREPGALTRRRPCGPGLSAPEQLQLPQETEFLLLHVPGDHDHVPVGGGVTSAEDRAAGLGWKGSGPASRAPLQLFPAALRLFLQPEELLLRSLQLRAQRLAGGP